MNRRMVRAKAARKFHAACTRQAQRLLRRISAGVVRITVNMGPMRQALDDAADVMSNFARAVMRDTPTIWPRRSAIDGECKRVDPSGMYATGGVARAGELGPRAREVAFQATPPRMLSDGHLFVRQPDGQLQHVGTTGPILLRLGHDPLPGQVVGCTCTVERVTKSDSQGQLRQVDIPSPPCAWCLDLEDRAAAEGFGLEPFQCCGTCGEPILDDDLTGTTCACATAPRPLAWSPLLCECAGTGPTCAYCRSHGVPDDRG